MSMHREPEVRHVEPDLEERTEYACPACGCRDLRARPPGGGAPIGNRKVVGGVGLRRVKYCRNCGKRVFTVERVE